MHYIDSKNMWEHFSREKHIKNNNSEKIEIENKNCKNNNKL